jgi:hypothetical protein
LNPIRMITLTRRLNDRAAPAALALGLAAATGALTLLALVWFQAAVALLYAAGFCALAWRYPAITLMLILASAPFQQDMSVGGPVRFSIAEIHLALAFPVFVLRMILQGRRVSLGAVGWPVLLYLGICIACSVLHWRATSLVSLLQMGIYMIVAVAIFGYFAPRAQDLRLSLDAVIWVGVALSILQIVAPGPLEAWFGLNKNGLGSSLASAVVICFELYLTAADEPRRRRKLMLAMSILSAALLMTLSRGSWMACLAGILLVVIFRRQFRLVLTGSLVLIPVLVACWAWLPAESRDYATSFDQSRFNISMRYKSIDFAEQEFHQSPITGVGVGLRKEYDATNVVLLTLAETGLPGLAAFLLIPLVICVMGWRIYHQLPAADPLTSFPILAAALTVGRLAHGTVDHYWSRGAILIAWGAVGMALAAQRSLRERRRQVVITGSEA